MYTLGQAAKAAGKSKSTILRALKDGKLSGSKDENGQYRIDPAELHRVFDGTVHGTANDAPRNAHGTPDDAATLRAELEAARALAEERGRTIDDLRERLDKESEERRKLTAMLTDQRTQPPPKRGFWTRLRGG